MTAWNKQTWGEGGGRRAAELQVGPGVRDAGSALSMDPGKGEETGCAGARASEVSTASTPASQPSPVKDTRVPIPEVAQPDVHLVVGTSVLLAWTVYEAAMHLATAG